MKYHNITKDDMVNGEGIRVVLWVSGCLHHCKNCQNPITWDVENGLVFDEDAKNEIYAELSKAYVSGLTVSGGDPLHPLNRSTVTELVKEVKMRFPDKNIWVYTGYEFKDVQDLEIIQYIDVLVDGKYIETLPSAEWVGSNNQKVIYVSNQKRRNETGI